MKSAKSTKSPTGNGDLADCILACALQIIFSCAGLQIRRNGDLYHNGFFDFFFQRFPDVGVERET